MSEFEKLLSWFVGKRLCDLCGKPLGNEPRYQIKGRHYHTDCYATHIEGEGK